MSDAERCKKNGWVVGTQLIGTEGSKTTVIELTAIGEQCILAKCVSHKGCSREGLWTLALREWGIHDSSRNPGRQIAS